MGWPRLQGRWLVQHIHVKGIITRSWTTGDNWVDLLPQTSNDILDLHQYHIRFHICRQKLIHISWTIELRATLATKDERTTDFTKPYLKHTINFYDSYFQFFKCGCISIRFPRWSHQSLPAGFISYHRILGPVLQGLFSLQQHRLIYIIYLLRV